MPEARLERLEGEKWWGGAVADGYQMAEVSNSWSRDLRESFGGNQAGAYLVSSLGRWIRSEQAFRIEVGFDQVTVSGPSPFYVESAPSNMRQGYLSLGHTLHWGTSQMPDRRLYTAPQYNTWIALQYEVSQSGVLAYAESLLDHGFPPGILMIDDGWQEDYGVWDFHAKRFPDPADMVKRLRTMGFTVMLWVVPYVSADSAVYRMLRSRHWLLADVQGEPVIRSWWNGQSASLDLLDPGAVSWFRDQLELVQKDFGISGFKFDGGDPEFYRTGVPGVQAPIYAQAWAEIGRHFPLNEFRACWLQAYAPLNHRLKDKGHSWGQDGLAGLIPEGMAASILGFPSICPDMVGGGEISSFSGTHGAYDGELLMRFAECSALFPGMQFSFAPWQFHESEVVQGVSALARFHQTMAPQIEEVVTKSLANGEPSLRPMAYTGGQSEVEPGADQFLLGDAILVAPQVRRHGTERPVWFPEGRWSDEGGRTILGPTWHVVSTELGRLNWFFRA